MDKVYRVITDQICLFEKQKKSPAVYALVGSFFYVMVGLCVKKLPQISATQILFFRCLISMGFNTTIIKAGNHNMYPTDPKIFRLLMMRCIFGGLAHICYYQAISMLSLSDAQAIFLTSPIWTIIMSSVLLGDSLSRDIIGSILISFTGIILIVKPPILLQLIGLNSSDLVSGDPLLFFLGIGAAFTFSILESVSAILIRSLSSSVPVTAILQYVYFSGFTFNGILLLISGEFSTMVYQLDIMLALMLLAGMNFLAQITASRALQLGTSQDVVPLTYSQLVMSFVVDIFILHKDFNWFSLIGSALILFGNFKIIMKK